MSGTLIAGCVELIPIMDVTVAHKVVDGEDRYLLKSSDAPWIAVSPGGFAIYSFAAETEHDPIDVVAYVDHNLAKLDTLGVGEHFGKWEVNDETGEVVDFIVSAQKASA